MIKITPEQIKNRYFTLPDILQDALFSSGSADEIWRMGAAQHFNEEKISLLAKIIGRVMMGFIRIEDTEKEIQEYLNIDPRIAASVAQEIKSRILSPLINEIREIYAPVFGAPEPLAISESTPVQPEVMPSPLQPKPTPIAEEKPQPVRPTLQIPTPPPAGQPFMLFKKEEQKPIAESIKGKITESFPAPQKQPSPAVRARLEIPGTPRIVHYNEARTPLDHEGRPKIPPAKPAAGKEEAMIDLSSFEPVKKPERSDVTSRGQPKVGGNVLDLR